MNEEKNITIAVHDGDFHADDVFAVATILLMLKSFFNVDIIRTREPNLIEKADYAVDVGGIYDEEKKRFDHHQTGGAGERPNGIPYASFGLVWKRWGAEISGSNQIASIIDEKLVTAIDAIDNGLDIVKPIFHDLWPYSLSMVIGSTNPNWKENPKLADDRFVQAVHFAREIINREIFLIQADLEGEQIIADIYKIASDKRLVVLEQNYSGKSVLSKFPEPLLVVYPKENSWRVKAVRIDQNSFGNRKDLPASWAGKRDQELTNITGVKDALFCHNKRFLATAKSKEGALALAKLALEE